VAAADPLDAIARCESGGNARASNGSHFGLYQFDLPTWRAAGGTGHPLNASAGDQHAAAVRLLGQRGTQPWNASRSCWAGKTAQRRVVSTAPHRAPAARPHPPAVRRVVSTAGSAVPNGYRVRSGDTLGRLATRYRTSVRAIAAANHIAHVDRIYVGQRLV
jgi:LysM repeat protein